MTCNCNSPFQSPWACPDQADPFALPQVNPLKVVVLDTRTNQIRPLLQQETPPQFPTCGTQNCGPNIGQLPTSKVMQDAYLELVTRLRAFEEKYCKCICSETPTPTPDPEPTPEPVEQVPDSWRSDVLQWDISSPMPVYGAEVEFPATYDLVKITVFMRTVSTREDILEFDYKAARDSLGNFSDGELDVDPVLLTGALTRSTYDVPDTEQTGEIVVMEVTIASPVRGTPLSNYINNNSIMIKSKNYMQYVTDMKIMATADGRAPIEISAQLNQPV